MMSDKKAIFSYKYDHPGYSNHHTYFEDSDGKYSFLVCDGQTGKKLENEIPKQAVLDHISLVMRKLQIHPQYVILIPPTKEILEELDLEEEGLEK